MIILNGLHGGVIIAGGIGKRLLPLTARTPKPLLSVNGKTPLERNVNALVKAEIKNVAITTGYLGEETEKCVFDNNGWLTDGEMGEKISVTYYREKTPMGTSGMVFKILPFLEDDFFVLSGDVVFDFPLCEMMKFHKEKNSAVTIAAVKSYSPTEYGTIISKNGIITAFREKPSWKQVISTKINAGIYIIKRSVAEKYDFGFTDFASEFFPFLLSKRETLACFEPNGFWCDMGTVESYLSCNMHYSGGENVMGDYISISPQSHIEGSVIMNGVKAGRGTKITSSVIAEGASIGKNCILENATVGPYALVCDNVIIKGGCVPEEAIVGAGKCIHSAKKQKELFSDSGLIFLPDAESRTAFFIGKALQRIAKERKFFLFHDGSNSAKSVYKALLGGIVSADGEAVSCDAGFLSLASFTAMKKSAFSLFVEKSPQKDGTDITIFDDFGLPLSREEQLGCEKNFVIQESLEREIFASKDDAIKWDAFYSYVLAKSQFEEDISETDIFLSNTAPCRLLSKILKKKGGSYEFSQREEEFINKKDCFFIDEGGTEAFCITKKGVRISKTELLSIAAIYYPQNNVSLPEYSPTGLKDIIISNGGGYSTYNDEIKGRKKADGFYNFNDGISIVLGVLCASALSKLSIDQMFETIPKLFFEERTVYIEGNKGEIFERLSETSKDAEADELQKTFDTGRAVVVPQYQNAFKIFAEAVSFEAADELLSYMEENISCISREKETKQ